ncbi:MAG: DUF1549 domain-containing protein [Verrucomicrobiales bacterium]|nr:DUF1549 domain-containing protein [Verrucomicrobiales bacterium]
MAYRHAFLIALLIAGLAQSCVVSAAEDGVAFFEKEVRPLLVRQCYECHSEESGKQKGGLLLDRRAGWERGGDAGSAVIPGEVEASLLIHSVRYLDEELQMPPKSRLTDAEVAVLERWVAMGAPDPRDGSIKDVRAGKSIDLKEARKGWAFRPLQNESPPEVEGVAWCRTPVDAFIKARLETEGGEPAADAEARTLVRRLHFDLNGLPPTRQEVQAFVAAARRDLDAAIQGEVDQLLARRAFGETWGRHWLDVVRYADSNGGDRNNTFYQAWRYRNYVIAAFNEDRSYYDLVREQVAGDLLPARDDASRRRQLIGATFLSLGPKMLTERDKEKLRLDVADEQIDTLGRAFLGLTLGCARCHDHKFDPIRQEDYYALAGIFRSTQVVMGTRNGCVNVASWVERALPQPEPEASALAAKLERLELIMRLKVEKDFMKKSGGKMTLDDLPLAGVLIDDEEAELVGAWRESSLSPNRLGARYLHDDRQGKGSKRAIFSASLPESGVYEVRLAYSSNAQRSKVVPVTVEAWREVKTVRLDQTRKPEIGGLFQSIGRFEFEKGGRVNVIVETTGTEGGYVIVDGVQFVAEKDLEREAKALAMMDGGDPVFRMSSGDLAKALTVEIRELRDAELAMAPRDAEDVGDCHLRVRGEVGQLGPLVRRNFLEVLHEGPPPEIPAGQSGRLQLAEWLAAPENALLDRVIVNRVWSHLFGRGLVASVDNFGALGTAPSHPELLDFLAQRFRAQGGSIKRLVRELALSRAYRVAAQADGPLVQADPENAWFGRREMRRLSAEEMRDAVLAMSGQLSDEVGKGTANESGDDLDKPFLFDQDRLRTVYLPVARNNMAPELELFDAANPDMVTGARTTTTVPTQALYLWNAAFLREQSAELARLAYATPDPMAWLYETVLGRAPTPAEAARAQAMLRALGGDEGALADLAHVLTISTEFLFLN